MNRSLEMESANSNKRNKQQKELLVLKTVVSECVASQITSCCKSAFNGCYVLDFYFTHLLLPCCIWLGLGTDDLSLFNRIQFWKASKRE